MFSSNFHSFPYNAIIRIQKVSLYLFRYSQEYVFILCIVFTPLFYSNMRKKHHGTLVLTKSFLKTYFCIKNIVPHLRSNNLLPYYMVVLSIRALPSTQVILCEHLPQHYYKLWPFSCVESRGFFNDKVEWIFYLSMNR